MRPLLFPALLILSVLPRLALGQEETPYQRALEAALLANPPGDYASPNPRRMEPVTLSAPTPAVSAEPVEKLLLRPVEPSEKSVPALFAEASSYFQSGRWGLAFKRYQQVLLAEPDNSAAKVNLYDLIKLHALYQAKPSSSEVWKFSRALGKRLAKESPAAK